MNNYNNARPILYTLLSYRIVSAARLAAAQLSWYMYVGLTSVGLVHSCDD